LNSVKLKKGNYVVFGSSGMIGTHLLKKINNLEGVNVKAIYFQNPPKVEGRNIRPLKIDITKSKNLKRILESTDTVFNFAGKLATSKVLMKDSITPIYYNIKIFNNLIYNCWLNNVKNFVWVSSTTGYSEKKINKEEDFFTNNPPKNWYGIGHMTRFFENFTTYINNHPTKKMKSIIVRPSLIYGEYDHFYGDEAHFIPSIIERISRNPKSLTFYGSPNEKRNIIYAGDVINILLKIFSKNCSPINIGYYRSFRLSDIIQKICNLMNFDYKKVVFKKSKNKKIEFEFSLEKMKQNLSSFEPTTIDEGLLKTIKWFEKNKK